MERLLCLLVGYACGCVLCADVVARARAQCSVFSLGNGNPGMANVARTLGKGPALACLAGDVGKVIVACALCRVLCAGLGPLAVGWAGIGATLGHDAPFWHGFRGGKGVATLSATLVLMSPLRALVAAAIAGITLVASGYLSVAAVAAAAAFALAMALTGTAEQTLLACLALALAAWGQWSNLRGIPAGTAKRDLPAREPRA